MIYTSIGGFLFLFVCLLREKKKSILITGHVKSNKKKWKKKASKKFGQTDRINKNSLQLYKKFLKPNYHKKS